MTLSLVVSVAIDLVYVVADPRWVNRLGEASTAAVAAVVLLRLFEVFPQLHGWAGVRTPLRVLSLLGCVGSVISALANVAALRRDLAGGSDTGER